MTHLFRVAETFASIQGESTWAGCPCFFIRLAGCNLRCSYCDTPYALEGGAVRALEELVGAAARAGLPLIEVTGGEPLLQSGTPDLLKALLPLGTVLLETNGSLDLAPVPDGVRIILDVKSPASGQTEAMRWENLDAPRPGDEIKFVLCDRADYEWARALLAERNLAAGGRTILFGAAFGRLSHADLAAWILEDRLPVRLNPVLHRWIWPDSTRGR